jgi:hypothetical protein
MGKDGDNQGNRSPVASESDRDKEEPIEDSNRDAEPVTLP